MKKHRSERAQALVLIVLAIVALFAFAALAVDGGRIFAERRRAQNAADAAAYAAAFAGAQGGNWQNAGIVSTQKNGYSDTDPNENSGADVDVRIHHQPVRGRYSVAAGSIIPNEYYQVIIRTKVDKVFAQLVYAGDFWIEVEAIARSTSQGVFPLGAAIVATCRDCCDALRFEGTGDIIVDGGGVVSNSNRIGDPSGCDSAERIGDAIVNVTGDFVAGGTIYDNPKKECQDPDGNRVSCTVAGSITQNSPNTNSYAYPHVPSCSGLPTVTKSVYNKTETLYPGIYTNGITASGNGTTITLSPGMYCLEGDLVADSASVVGTDIMIYMRSGSVKITTTKNPVSLSAPYGAQCINDPGLTGVCWSGFLIFMPDSNTGAVYMAGGGTSNYTGTVYAVGRLNPKPFNLGSAGSVDQKCTIRGGREEVAVNVSFICYTVSIAGGNSLTIQYDANLNAQSPGSLELTE